MNKIKNLLFKNKLSDGDDRLVNFFTLMALSWLPPIVAFNFADKRLDIFALFGIIYACLTALLYIFIRMRMASKSKNHPVTSVKAICISVMILHSFSMIFAYTYKILSSKESLWITIPLSLFITFFCVEAWINKSNEKKSI